jgi:hypothetical protein
LFRSKHLETWRAFAHSGGTDAQTCAATPSTHAAVLITMLARRDPSFLV